MLAVGAMARCRQEQQIFDAILEDWGRNLTSRFTSNPTANLTSHS